MSMIWTISAAVIGGFTAFSTGMPAPWLIGSLLGTAVFALAGIPQSVSKSARNLFAQPVITTAIGCQVTPLLFAKGLPFLSATGLIWANSALICFIVLMLLQRRTRLDPVTTYLCAIPGALTQITAMLDEHPADAKIIALFQTLRLSAFLIGMPLLLLGLGLSSSAGKTAGNISMQPEWLPALAFCVISGPMLAKRVGLMTPSLLGPLLLSAGMHATGISTAQMPVALMIPAQLVLGAAIGSRLSGIELRRVAGHLPLIAGSIAIMAGSAIAMALLLASLTGCSYGAAALFLIPGGLGETGIIALALNIAPDEVGMQHALRILFLYAAIPCGLRLWLRMNTGRDTRGLPQSGASETASG